MAPSTVVSSAHCCAGAPQRLSAERYYSHGTYPAGGECVLYADIVFARQSFLRFSPRYWLCIVGSTKLLVYLSTRRQSVFYHSSDLNPASTSSRRLSDAHPTPRDKFLWTFFFKSEVRFHLWPFETKRRLPEPAEPADKSDCDTDPRQRRIRETGRGAHAWHTSPFDLMAIPRM